MRFDHAYFFFIHIYDYVKLVAFVFITERHHRLTIFKSVFRYEIDTISSVLNFANTCHERRIKFQRIDKLLYEGVRLVFCLIYNSGNYTGFYRLVSEKIFYTYIFAVGISIYRVIESSFSVGIFYYVSLLASRECFSIGLILQSLL